MCDGGRRVTGDDRAGVAEDPLRPPPIVYGEANRDMALERHGMASRG